MVGGGQLQALLAAIMARAEADKSNPARGRRADLLRWFFPSHIIIYIYMYITLYNYYNIYIYMLPHGFQTNYVSMLASKW